MGVRGRLPSLAVGGGVEGPGLCAGALVCAGPVLEHRQGVPSPPAPLPHLWGPAVLAVRAGRTRPGGAGLPSRASLPVLASGRDLDPGLVERVRSEHSGRCGGRALRLRALAFRLLPVLVAGWLGFLAAVVAGSGLWSLLCALIGLPPLLLVARSTFVTASFEHESSFLVRPLGVLVPGPGGAARDPEHYSPHFASDLVALVGRGDADALPLSVFVGEVRSLALDPYLDSVLSASEREVFDVLFAASPDVSLAELLGAARRV